MTIRDFLKRRVRVIVGVAFGAWLVLPLSSVVSDGHEPPGPAFFVAFLGFGAAVIAYLFLVKCPRCKTRLGQLSGEIAFHWGTRARVNFCPYCGVELDKELEASPGSH